MIIFKSVSGPAILSTALLSLALSGCTETPGKPLASSSSASASASASARSGTKAVAVSRGKTADEIKLENNVRNLNQITRDIIVRNTVQGAVVGALGGCVLARLTDNDCARGAVAGGIAGGIFGNQVGRKAANANAELVKLDATIAKLKNVQQRLSGVESGLRSVLRKQNAEIASLRRQLAAGQVTASSVKSRIGSINDNRRTVIQGLEASEANVSKERVQLASLEKQSGRSYGASRSLVTNTEKRIRSLRNTVQLVSN